MHERTIDALVDRAVYLGSLDGMVGSGLRHETAEAFTEANASYRALRDLLEQSGYDLFRDSTAPASLPAVDADFNWRVAPWPTTYKRVVGVDVRWLASGRRDWYSLTAAAWTQRHRFACFDTAPDSYVVRNAASTADSGEIYLIPGGAGSGQYVVHFVAEHVELVTTESFVYPIGAAEDWHAADLAMRLSGVRDGDAEGRVRALMAMRGEAEGKVRDAGKLAVPDARATPVRLARPRRRRESW